MTKLNQKGFTIIEAIILLIILGLIAGLCWYVWMAKSNSQSTTKSSATSGTSRPAADVYAGWKTFTDSQHGLSFKYPADWTINSSGYKSEEKYGTILIESPDVAKHEESIGGYSIAKGSSVSLTFSSQGGKTLEQNYASSFAGKNFTGTKESHKIGNDPAYEYEFAYEGQLARYIVFNHGGTYFVQGSLTAQDISKSSRDYATFVKILESIMPN